MHLLILTDIFGLCKSLDVLVMEIEKQNTIVNIIDPYDKKRHTFATEKEAYATFLEACGHDAYLAKTKETLSIMQPTLCIGFSIGASVLWRLSAWEGLRDTKLLCFYPSQIRYYLDIHPQVQTDVIFPHSEDSFDVHVVSEKIQCHDLVQTKVTAWSHGFMNRCSVAYNQVAQRWGVDLIAKEIKYGRSP